MEEGHNSHITSGMTALPVLRCLSDDLGLDLLSAPSETNRYQRFTARRSSVGKMKLKYYCGTPLDKHSIIFNAPPVTICEENTKHVQRYALFCATNKRLCKRPAS